MYPEDRDPGANVAGSWPREDNVRRVLRNNGLSAHPCPEIDCNPSAMRAHRARAWAGCPEVDAPLLNVDHLRGQTENLKERISMLDQTVSRIPHIGVIEPPVSPHVDRSMDVLQYATAFIAALVAVLLAAVH